MCLHTVAWPSWPCMGRMPMLRHDPQVVVHRGRAASIRLHVPPRRGMAILAMIGHGQDAHATSRPSRTPQGFTLNSRGQGHALGARRPRIASRTAYPTLKGSNQGAPPRGQQVSTYTATVAFTHGYSRYSPSGSGTFKPLRVSSEFRSQGFPCQPQILIEGRL